jgi:hypothetical protein
MRIVGSTPETGVRIDVTRPREGGPPWLYEGEAVTSNARIPVKAVVSGEGQVTVELQLPAGAPAESVHDGPDGDTNGGLEGTAERVRLLLRAAYKHAREDAQPPPRRIVRWRADVDVAPPRRGG